MRYTWIVLIVSALFFIAYAEAGPRKLQKAIIEAQLKSTPSVSEYNMPFDKETIARYNDMPTLSELLAGENFDGYQKQKSKQNFKRSVYKTKDTVDLTIYDTPIKRQDNGKCTAYSGIAGVENKINQHRRMPELNLSEWYIWPRYQIPRRQPQYSTYSFINAASYHFMTDEKYYPQYGEESPDAEKKAWVKIKKYKKLYDDADAAREELSKGNPVILAMSTPVEMLRCRATIPNWTNVASGGHAILLTGWEKADVAGGGYFTIKNSWGSSCGDGGYHYMDVKFICQKQNFYCYMISIQELEYRKPISPSPSPNPTPVPIPDPDEDEDEDECQDYRKGWWPPKCWFQSCCFDED